MVNHVIISLIILSTILLAFPNKTTRTKKLAVLWSLQYQFQLQLELFLQQLQQQSHQNSHDNKILTSVKNTIIGGSALSLPTLQEFDEVHDVNVIHAWGMTEMSPLGTINVPTSEMENMSKEEKYAIQLKQGKPIYGVELKVVDDAGIELPKDGESQGHLMVRGPWILQKYFKAEKDAVDKDGWFDTGDINNLRINSKMLIKLQMSLV